MAEAELEEHDDGYRNEHAAAQADAETAQNARLIALEKLLTDKAGDLQTVTLKAGK